MTHQMFAQTITEAFGSSMPALGLEFLLSSIDPDKVKVVEEDINHFTRLCYFRTDIPEGMETMPDSEASLMMAQEGGDEKGDDDMEWEEEEGEKDDAYYPSYLWQMRPARMSSSPTTANRLSHFSSFLPMCLQQVGR